MKDEKSLNNTVINWYPGHMAKTRKQIIEDLKLVHVVIEIIDARVPISSQNPDIDNLVGNKQRIIILNKADLADEKENEKWLSYFNKKGTYAFLVNSNSGDGVQKVEKEIKNIMLQRSEIISAKGITGNSIRGMIVGIPNVGKSSFINRISKGTAATVGNKPGVTKQKHWIRMQNGIELLDTPGVLWPKFEDKEVGLNLAYIGTIGENAIDNVEVAFYLLKYLLKNEKEKLYTRYKLTETEVEISSYEEENEWVLNVMHIIGRKRGALISGGNIDETKTSQIILDDFQSGKIGKITIEKVGGKNI